MNAARPHVLDAGCGSSSADHAWRELIPFPLQDAHVTGLDVDAEALETNPRLHERIIGNVESYPLPAAAFDVVVCWNVLEHLRQPYHALNNLAHTLKPGGAMVLAFPNLLSLKGVVTKFTPLAFHRWVYRHVYKTTLEPYPTVLPLTLRPQIVRRWAEARDYSASIYFEDSRILGWRSECRAVLVKPALGP